MQSMWRSRKVFKVKILSKVWEMVLAATCWTIWLTRNEMLFQNKEPDIKVILHLIKFRVLSWGLAYGLIMEDKSLWWCDNPTGTVTASYKTKWFNILKDEDCSIAAFVDGSWKKGKYSKGGIGGIVKTAQGDHLLEFAGPVYALSAFQAKLQALQQLVKLIICKGWMTRKVLILTDNTQLVEAMKGDNLFPEWESIQSTISLRHINRVFNMQADKLAKSGSNLHKLWTRWAQI